MIADGVYVLWSDGYTWAAVRVVDGRVVGGAIVVDAGDVIKVMYHPAYAGSVE